jgi:primary-amine oxidase
MTDKVCGTPSKLNVSPSSLKKHSHPLDPLDADEVSSKPLRKRKQRLLIFRQIVAATRVVQLYAAEKLSTKALRFILCNLLLPPKRQVLAYLGIPLATGQEPEAHPGEIPRKAEVEVSILLYPKTRG